MHGKYISRSNDFSLQAILRDGSQSTTIIPQATVPLNTNDCMCSSLSDLATQSGHTVIEPECLTNQQCNGVICQMNLFHNVFYFENIILPCNYAINVIIQDAQFQPTYVTFYNRTESQPILLGFFPMTLYVEILRLTYSMEISVSYSYQLVTLCIKLLLSCMQAILDTRLYGNATLLPHHTILLDKTRCDLPNITTIAPPTAQPPPASPPPSAPESCHAFYSIIRATRSEPFLCKAMADCETGILCTLELLDTFYTINITVLNEGKAIIFSVTDSNQSNLGSATSRNTTISLPNSPNGTALIFKQTVSAQSIGFSVRSS